MSSNTKKRSRKSKLTPRQCTVDSEDEDVYLQSKSICKENTIKRPQHGVCDKNLCVHPRTSKIPKISEELEQDVPKETVPPIHFQVKVEVEECDDDYFEEENMNIDEAMQEVLRISLPKFSEPENCLTGEQIIEESNKIVAESDNIAEKILDVGVKNVVGLELWEPVKLTGHEKNIQEILDTWKSWKSSRANRNNPLFYKCYICRLSWWHLGDFRTHIEIQHEKEDLKIKLEMYTGYEVNIVAFTGNQQPKIRDFEVEGFCTYCGKTYHSHKLSERVGKKFYTQYNGCKKLFTSCSDKNNHIRYCIECRKGYKYYCSICKSILASTELLDQHLKACHIVRSDMPIENDYKTCELCKSRYICEKLHPCKTVGKWDCVYCFRSFFSQKMCRSHMEKSIFSYQCVICGANLPWNCQKYEHMLSHSKNYVKVKKCMACKGFSVFANDDEFKTHKQLKHEYCNVEFVHILIPKTCLQPADKEEIVDNHSVLPLSEIKSEIQSDIEEQPASKDGPLPALISEPALDDEPAPEYESASENEPASEGLLVLKDEPASDSEPAQEEHYVLKEETASKEELVLKVKSEEQSSSRELNESVLKQLILQNIKIKDEPEEIIELDQIVIKEEIPDYNEAQEESPIENYNFDPEITIKEEFEFEEMEEDIIKLNFDISDHLQTMLKEEPNEKSIDSKSVHQSLDTSTESINKSKKNKKRKYTCRKCGLTAMHREYKLHKQLECESGCTENVFDCTKCERTFVTIKSYLKHLVDHGYTLLSCPECLQIFKRFSALTGHIFTHIKRLFLRVKFITIESGNTNRSMNFQCKKCSNIVSADQFFKHWELHVASHPGEVDILEESETSVSISNTPPLQYSKPCLEFQEEGIQESLRLLHFHKKMDCNQCGRRFNRISETKRHIIEHLLAHAHATKILHGELRCQMCGMGFNKQEKYKQHMRDHASLPVYKCELCDRTFSDSSNFTKHKKVHNFKSLMCDLCGKKFQMKLMLEKHMELHKTSSPIKCERCDKVFPFETTYKRHIRNFHEKIVRFRCVICKKQFPSLKLKWNHMWEVHKERKATNADCPLCSKSYRKYMDVKNHLKDEHKIDMTKFRIRKNNLRSSLININLQVEETETLVVY